MLLKEEGEEYVLSEKFNQDPREQYFSKQRGVGGSSDNHTVEQFGHNIISIYVASSSIKASKRGNTKTKPGTKTSLDNTPLPKRPKLK